MKHAYLMLQRFLLKIAAYPSGCFVVEIHEKFEFWLMLVYNTNRYNKGRV